jgi:short-subunit dehydrogenase
MELKDKVVIVTGASSGIGLAAARLLSKHGAKVSLASRSLKLLEKLSSEIPNSIVVPTDMTKVQQIKRMVEQTVEHFGRVDILINNAGRGYDAPVEKTDIETLHYIFDLDVVGPLVAIQHVIPFMRKQGGGAIINVSSGTALMYLPNMSAYSACKRALAGISLTAREELKDDNINVTVVYPYITLTGFEKNTIKDIEPIGADDDDKEQASSRRFPPDSAEYVAQKILEGIESGAPEIFAHDWMRAMAERKA